MENVEFQNTSYFLFGFTISMTISSDCYDAVWHNTDEMCKIYQNVVLFSLLVTKPKCNESN